MISQLFQVLSNFQDQLHCNAIMKKKLNVKRLIVRHTQCTDERTSFLCHLYMHVLCLQAIEDRFRISTKELLKFEFQAVIALEFDLHVPQWEVLPHAKRMETE